MYSSSHRMYQNRPFREFPPQIWTHLLITTLTTTTITLLHSPVTRKPTPIPLLSWFAKRRPNLRTFAIRIALREHIGSLHCIRSSDSRNAYTVSDHPSSWGPLNLQIRYQMRNTALPVIIGLRYIRDWPPGSKLEDQECRILKMPDIKNAGYQKCRISKMPDNKCRILKKAAKISNPYNI